MKTYPKISDFILPGKEIRVSEESETKIIQEMANHESDMLRQEAKAIQESRKIILDLLHRPNLSRV